jgi:NTE family protein
MAHIGALQALEGAKIPIDMLAGTSAGGVVSALYAAGHSAAGIRDIVGSIRLLDIVQRGPGGPGLLGRQKTARLLVDVMGGDITFADLKVPLGLVAVDIDTAEEVVIREGSVIEGVLATTAVPGIFPPQPWRGRYLVDGGVTNPLPCDVIRDMGAERVVAVNTTGRFPGACTSSGASHISASGPLMHTLLRQTRWNQVLDVLESSICIMTDVLSKQRIRACPPDVTIEIVLENVGAFDLSKLDVCMRAGEEATRAHMSELKAL